MKSTKRKSDVWDFFHVKAAEEKVLYECKYCGTGYVKNATRMKKHFVSYSKIPSYIEVKTATPFSAVRDAASEPSSSADIETSAVVGECANASLSAAALSTLKMGKSSTLKRTLDRYFESMNQTENRQLDELLTRAIYSSGSSVSLVENEDWITFMEKLRPSYKLPSRSTLSNKLLESEYQRVEALVTTKLAEGPVLALRTDSWSNRRNESVVNFVVTTPEPFFFQTLGTKAERDTAEYMAAKMDDVMREIEIEKFGAIVTDNASVTVKASLIL
jgi:hypothetical protein